MVYTLVISMESGDTKLHTAIFYARAVFGYSFMYNSLIASYIENLIHLIVVIILPSIINCKY